MEPLQPAGLDLSRSPNLKSQPLPKPTNKRSSTQDLTEILKDSILSPRNSRERKNIIATHLTEEDSKLMNRIDGVAMPVMPVQSPRKRDRWEINEGDVEANQSPRKKERMDSLREAICRLSLSQSLGEIPTPRQGNENPGATPHHSPTSTSEQA